jgi:hypothetical protein
MAPLAQLETVGGKLFAGSYARPISGANFGGFKLPGKTPPGGIVWPNIAER